MQQVKDQLLTILRDVKTPISEFRRTTEKLTEILVVESMTLLENKPHKITTPITEMTGSKLDNHVVLIPVLRAGLAMLPIFLKYFEEASTGFFGFNRDKTTYEANMYFANIPNILPNTKVILIDPILATGNTTCSAVTYLNKMGVEDRQIIFAGILAAPEGKNHLETTHPEIKMVIGAVDKRLNEVGYIVPGIGDFGDRFFGTN
ncbi:MAG: uracil phosphoribosyltransferase [Chlamydiota bacterium]|nr:uracil phosphoribosyltransferase [Chlamydiota bacterium]